MAGADETHYGLVAQYLTEFPPRLQSQLVEQAGSYTALFAGPPESLEPQFQEIVRRLQQEYHQQRWSDQIDSIMVLVERLGAQIIPITSLDYPQQLKQISSAPPLLYSLGQTDNLHLPQIAIVGSRRMTRGGENNALQWSRFLANSGFTITSGLALLQFAHAAAESRRSPLPDVCWHPHAGREAVERTEQRTGHAGGRAPGKAAGQKRVEGDDPLPCVTTLRRRRSGGREGRNQPQSPTTAAGATRR